MADKNLEFNSAPFAKLGVIVMPGCEEIGQQIDEYLVKWRKERAHNINVEGYARDSYRIKVSLPRFGTGEGKGVISESIRGLDLFIICDCFNYGVTHNVYGMEVPTSPDEHFANLKRIISAAAGKTHRITVIMPMLYEGRQHKRSARESLDCALALQELERMGVENIITFDAHDPRVQNAVPLLGFENVQPSYQLVKAMIKNVPDLIIDKDHLMCISPDEGGMGRCIYLSSVLGIELGMFYKRRDYSVIVNGRNPIIAHEFLGDNVSGKDVLIVDDMISSGESMIEVATKLKALGAKRIFVFVSFALFCNGLDEFDKAYKNGIIDKVFSTNLIYRTPELLEREWYAPILMQKYCAYLIDTLNHDMSVSKLLDPSEKIKSYIEKYACKPENAQYSFEDNNN
ncbi:MAG: ribose-phosphate pyrophosphokinase [Acutalibacteraceae bacterium]